MQKYFKKLRILALIFFGVELLICLTLVLFEFVLTDFLVEVTNFIREYHFVYIILVSLMLLNWLFFFIVTYRLNRIRIRNNLSTAHLFGGTIQDSIDFAQLGIIVVDDNQDIIWTNEVINQANDALLDRNILDVFPKLREFQNKTETFDEKKVLVTIKDIIFSVSYLENSHVYFFKNVTDYEKLYKFSKDEAVCLGIVMIDNYEELAAGEEDTSDVLARVKTSINEYFKNNNVLLRKYLSNSYFAICNYNSLQKMKDDNFSILDTVKEQATRDELVPTLSIGFAHDFPSVTKLNEMAINSIEIAISRGGDQVVISKYSSDLQFFGGKSEGIEKRNKVKVRILADSLISIIKGAKNVLVMGHKDMDMDALGSCLGIKAICKSVDIPCNIVYDSKLVERKARNAFSSTFSKDEARDIIYSPKEALSKITTKTKLICVDFHRPSLALSKEVLEACDKVAIIDHHRRSEEFIENPIFNYIETSASSASELIVELIRYSSINPPIDIPSNYATIMLAGVFLDTNYYRSTTSGLRTFEASMILRGFGADNTVADDFLKDEYEEKLLISKIVSTIKTPYTGIVYCVADKNLIVDPETLAKAANECMSMKGINAAFAIGRISDKDVKFSGRSDGSINVQLLCEKLGGGGHFTMAAGIVKTNNPDDVVERLEDVLRVHIDDARRNGSEGD